MIDAINLYKSYGAQQVLADASFRCNPNERLALVGPNGAGKTTLLRLLAGQESPDSGTLALPRGLQVGYLPQEIDVSSPLPLRAFVEDVAADVRRVEEEMRDAEVRLAAGDTNPDLLDRYGHLRTRFEHLDGYTLGARAERILAGLGFRAGDFDRPLAEFSGGWRMRAALGRILLREPDLVLLDEPTNHLDIDSLEWLEDYLREARGCYLMVSHDAAFLDRVVDGVLALEGGEVVRAKGNYTRYCEQRALRHAQAQAAYDNFQRKRNVEQQFVDRFRSKATKARQVQSRVRRMEKEQAPPPPPSQGPVLGLNLPQPARSGRTVLTLEGVELGYGGQPVHRNLQLRLERGDKAVLIGPNGAGKSTLLKALAGLLAPTAGRVETGHNVTLSYFAQHQLEQLDPRRSVLEEMARVPGLSSELQMRSILGSFLFSGDAVDKPVAVLSGGEKSRLVLARLLAAPGNLLLLDEPTNHLDLQACEVLKQALARYQGTVCLITHDRDLINRVATRVLYLDGQGVTEYLGNYDDYVARRAAEQAAAHAVHPASGGDTDGGGRKEQRRREAERRQRLQRETAPLRRQVESLEAEVAVAEEQFTAVEAQLAAPDTYQDPRRATALARERAALEARVGELSAAWEAAATELEERERWLRQGWQAGDGAGG
ncbi:MAG TPA: ABC-F family ATP-binding cassette domain-containing protein [Deferrisomatales bacterium]|nr:ABC-F family ATP-binding cassette domain-containing protein [Deferrisomatales bacterium]